MINRINLILRAKNITARQFAEEIGIQPSGMSHILSGRNNPSLEFLTKVIRRYPEIDANWLLLGRGAMYTSQSAATVTPTLPSTSDDEPVPVNEESETELWEESNEELELPDDEVKHSPTGRRIVKMVVLYDDHTFAEYRPE